MLESPEVLAVLYGTAIAGIGSVTGWLLLSVSRNTQQTKLLEERLRGLAAELPTHKELHDLTMLIADLRGDIGVLRERSTSIGRILDRHERYLEGGDHHHPMEI